MAQHHVTVRDHKQNKKKQKKNEFLELNKIVGSATPRHALVAEPNSPKTLFWLVSYTTPREGGDDGVTAGSFGEIPVDLARKSFANVATLRDHTDWTATQINKHHLIIFLSLIVFKFI